MSDRKSLPFSEFPHKFQRAVRRLETPRRGRRRYSKCSVKSTIHHFGQYLAVVQRAGLPLELSTEGLTAFIDDLDTRDIRPATQLTYLSGVHAIAKEVDYPASQRRLILEDCEIYREQMCRTLPIKVRKLAAHPITLKDIARAAVKWRDTAQQTNEHNKRRTYFQRSAILALLSLTPLRIGDATRLLIGDHVKRDEAGWSLRISSEKSGYRHNGRLHSSLTPYLDDLLLYGEGGSVYLHYAQRVGGPLFATEMHEYLSSRTLAYNFKVATGHSPHIVRTLVHDAMAKFGTYGADLARILCGQRSLAIGKHYEVYAARLRAEEAQKSLAEIQAKIIPIAPPATDNFRDGPRV